MNTARIFASTDAVVARAKNTHYAVSTFAAVVYALVWLLTSGAHAATPSAPEQAEQITLPAVVVSASRIVLPEVVVAAKREMQVAVAMLEPVVVVGSRESGQTRIAANDRTKTGVGAKFRSWFRAALAKVSG